MAEFQPPPTYTLPIVVDERTGKAQFSPIWLKWFLDLAALLNNLGGTSPSHNSLAGLQGGTTNQYFHATSAQNAKVVAWAGSATVDLLLPVGTTGIASLRIPHGAAPTTPVNGDIWTTTGGLFVRINGVTVGPLT